MLFLIYKIILSNVKIYIFILSFIQLSNNTPYRRMKTFIQIPT